MTLRQRRDQLQAEVSKLLDIVVDYHIDVPSAEIENRFMDELEAQLIRKTAELEALNARIKSPIYSFWETSHGLLVAIWSLAVMLCAAARFFPPMLGPGYGVVFAVAAITSVIWAVWSTHVPST